MIDFSNKWKILSIGLMAILASGLAAPQAYALINQDILSIVQNIQFQVNNKTYGLQAIMNKLNTLPGQTAIGNLQTSVNGVQTTVNGIQTTVNAEQPIGIIVDKSTLLHPLGVTLNQALPPVNGKTYSGHISLMALGGSDTIVRAFCSIPENKIIQVGPDSSAFSGGQVNDDFTCLSLQIEQVNQSNNQNETSTAIGVIQYQFTTNTSTIQ